MNTSHHLAIAAAAAASLACGSAHAVLTVFADFTGDSAYDATHDVLPGASFTMKLYAKEDGLHGGLTSYGVEILLQPTLTIDGIGVAAQLANIVSDPQWDLPETKSVSPIEAIDGTLFNSYLGTVHLVDVTLLAPAAPGAYTVSFKNVEPDATFDGFVGSDGFVYDATTTFQSSTVNVVPEPATGAMLALGIAVIGWIGRRRLQGDRTG